MRSMFRSFVLILEQKCPLVHRLHDEMKETTKYFLASFLKIEDIPDDVQGVDVKNKNFHLALHFNLFRTVCQRPFEVS